MNTKTTYLVVLFALGLGAYFLVFETDLFDRRNPSDRDQSQQPTAVTGQGVLDKEGKATVKKEDVKQLTVELPGQPVVTLTSESGKWVQTAPVRFAADSFAVDGLLDSALAVRSTQSFRPSEKMLKLDQLGLAPVQAKLTLASGDGKPLATLCLGKRVIAGGAYLTLGEPSETSAVLVVGNSLHDALLDAPAHKWRSKTLASFLPTSVRSIKLTRDGEAIELKQTDGLWSLEQKELPGRADRAAAQQLTDIFKASTIDQFVQDSPPSLETYGLDKPAITLTVEAVESAAAPATEKEKPAEPKTVTHKLVIGSPRTLSEESYFAMLDDAPVVFTLRKVDVEKLKKPVDSLRDPRLAVAARADLKSIRIEQPGKPALAFVREGETWKFGDPAPAYGLEQPEIEKLVGAILETRATGYSDTQDLPAPLLTVTLATIAGKEEEKLSIREKETGKIIVVRNAESTGYVVDRATLEQIFSSALAFRDRKVLGSKEEDIAKVRILRTGEHAAEYTIAREETKAPDDKITYGKWNIEGLDAIAVEDLFAHLAPLRAAEWLAEPSVTTPEGVSIEITLKDGSVHKVFIHTASRNARVEGVSDTFRVSEDFAAAAQAEFRDRLLLKLELDALASVKLGETTMRRSPEGVFKIEGGEKISESASGGIFDTLAGLKVERYLPAESAGVDLAKPDHTLTLKTTGDEPKTHTLRLWAPTDSRKTWLGRLDDGKDLFTLPANTALRIIGKAPPRELPGK